MNAWQRSYDRDTGEPLMFPAEVAALLRVTARHVTRMAEKGRLAVALRTDTGFRYRIGDVIDMACREDREAERKARTRR
jgi:hypothetical protein